MRFHWLSGKVAVLAALLVGMPLVEQARADDFSSIADGALSLAGAIIDAAGNS
jgi:hypothetical protein